jgi:SET domain-containing protein
MTDQFSFVLRPSSIGGIGVFTTHKIKKGTILKLFNTREKTVTRRSSDKNLSPKYRHKFLDFYCVYDNETKDYNCPRNFGRMSVGWHLNHSNHPNTIEGKNDTYIARNDIAAGTEITIDYRNFGPGNLKFQVKSDQECTCGPGMRT